MSDSKDGVNTIGIYVENHSSQCLNSLFKYNSTIWNGEKGSLPLLMEGLWFLKLAPWRRVIRTMLAIDSSQRNPGLFRLCPWLFRIMSLLFSRSVLVYLGHSSCGWEGGWSTLLTWEHQKSIRNHWKSMILKMNQDTYGDFLDCQEWPGMIFDTTRLHITWFQQVTFRRNLKILSKSWPGFHTCARIQNLRWT